jgi:hypothetical protein
MFRKNLNLAGKIQRPYSSSVLGDVRIPELDRNLTGTQLELDRNCDEY